MSSQFDADEKLWKGASVPYPYPGDVYLGEKIIEALKATPDRILQISHEENSELVADDFRLSIIRVAQNLQRRGIEGDDVVGVTCRNSNAVTVLINACVLIGAPLSPLDVAFTKDDIRHMFGQTKPKLVICDYDAYLKVKKALRELNNDAQVFTTGGKVAGVPEFRDLLSPTGTEEDFRPPKFAVEAWKKILVIIFSSGTTGLPKGICATHGQILMWFGVYQNRFMSRSLAFSSTYWASGFYPTIMLASSVNDIRILTNQRFSIKALIELVEPRKVTTMIMQPSQLALMVQSREFKQSDYSSLESIIVGGSIVSDALRKKFTETFPGIRLSVTYGMSEASMTIPMECSEGLAVGKIILPNNIIKIVDEDGNRLGVGERGELCVKSLFDFVGYYNNPEATANAVDSEGFYKSGDIGYFDEAGFLYIIDRKKEIYKYKGFQFNPSEIENVIQDIDGVRFVAVLGIPDPEVTDLPTAVIVKQDGYEHLSQDDISKVVERKLPESKHLHGGVFFLDELPMTLSGKIKKKVLVDVIIEKRKMLK